MKDNMWQSCALIYALQRMANIPSTEGGPPQYRPYEALPERLYSVMQKLQWYKDKVTERARCVVDTAVLEWQKADARAASSAAAFAKEAQRTADQEADRRHLEQNRKFREEGKEHRALTAREKQDEKNKQSRDRAAAKRRQATTPAVGTHALRALVTSADVSRNHRGTRHCARIGKETLGTYDTAVGAPHIYDEN